MRYTQALAACPRQPDPWRLNGEDSTYPRVQKMGSISVALSVAAASYSFYSVAKDNVGNKEQAPEIPDATTTVNTGCFIATSSFGTEMVGKIDVLRYFRDRYLVTGPAGRELVETYYRITPPMAQYIAGHGWLRAVVRLLLLPVVGLVSLFV